MSCYMHMAPCARIAGLSVCASLAVCLKRNHDPLRTLIDQGSRSLVLTFLCIGQLMCTLIAAAGVISWKECLNNNAAWDTLTWFAALIAMAAYLNKVGISHDSIHDLSHDSWSVVYVTAWLFKWSWEWHSAC